MKISGWIYFTDWQMNFSLFRQEDMNMVTEKENSVTYEKCAYINLSNKKFNKYKHEVFNTNFNFHGKMENLYNIIK
jgi:hypothetical protein